MEETHNKKWWDYWRHYKTANGARKYAEKHKGVWIVMLADPSMLTDEEIEDLGRWIVGRSDEYLFFERKHGVDFAKKYSPIEIWKDHKMLVDNLSELKVEANVDEIENLSLQIEEVDNIFIENKDPVMKNKLEQLADQILLQKFGL
ncbi:MAG: hypothetical protein CMB49_03060 [Euryarchaeota archaeon]|nr:hypothetical protein [Euryarchaeota archaeon]